MYRIMYFLDYGQAFGGAANALLQQAILMKKAGYRATLVISNYINQDIKEGYNNICLKSNLDILRIPYQISSQPEDIDLICITENYNKVRDTIREHSPDILHSIQINPIVELASRELHIPHIMNIYPLIPEFFSINYIDIFPHFHICDSNYYAEKWKHYLNTDSTCIRTVVNKRNPVRSDVRRDEKINYFCVGSIYKEKSQLEVIKAFHMALTYGISGKLLLYGYAWGSYAEKCRNYIADNRLGDEIILMGFSDDMQAEYLQGDVLICGSTRESYPNVISEAMANGLIVITTPVAGVPEVIKDGINGYLCEGYTKDEICNKIRQFDEERKGDKAKEILSNAYQTYDEIHSPSSVTKELLQYYQYVLENKKRFSEIGIQEIKGIFADIINLYYEHQESFSNPKAVKAKLWYIFYVRGIINKISVKEKSIYIWGTGKYALTVKEILEVFFPTLEPANFIDTYKQGTFRKRRIYTFEDIMNDEESIIFVGAINGQEEIVRRLEDNLRIFNVNYFILAPRRW